MLYNGFIKIFYVQNVSNFFVLLNNSVDKSAVECYNKIMNFHKIKEKIAMRNKKNAIPKIVEFNRDIEHIMHASCRWGFHGHGIENKAKTFAMLVGADFHGCGARFDAMIDYLNYYDALDCGIQMGDLMPSNFTEDDSWYSKGVKKSKKPFFGVLGNHDVGNNKNPSVCGTQEMAFERFFAPFAKQMGVEDLQKTYYVRYFDRYKIALIVLDTQETPLDKDENGNYIIGRGTQAYSQEQMQWLTKTLESVPAEYHVIIAMHNFLHDRETVACNFSQLDVPYDMGDMPSAYGHCEVLTDIVNAWKNGEALKGLYKASYQEEYFPPIQIDCDFSSRGKGEFVGYFVGHNHRDYYAVSKKYPDQSIVAFISAADDLWQNYGCDLARAKDTKAHDALTVVSVDTNLKEVRLVRVGSNITMDLVDRTYFTFKY